VTVRSVIAIHAESALRSSTVIRTSYLKCPSALNSETVEDVRRTAEAWSKLAERLEGSLSRLPDKSRDHSW